jgi:hypothetical protein
LRKKPETNNSPAVVSVQELKDTEIEKTPRNKNPSENTRVG